MSHNITMTGTRINDMSLLGNIVEEISKGQARLDMSAKNFRTWRGQDTTCDAAIKMPGPHDIGFKQNADGDYVPVFDPYSMSDVLQSPHGSNKMGAVLQEYTLQQAEYEAAQNGFSSSRVQGEKGVVTLELVQA